MLELKRFVKIIIFSIVLLFVSFSSYAQEATSESTGLASLMGKKVNEQLCTRAGVKTVETFLEIQLEMIKSMDNMLPITIGGISIGNPGELEGLGSSGVSEAASQNTSSEFICECIFLPPFIPYRYGVTLSFWESIGVIDTTAIPYCSASLGMNVDIGGAVSSAAESVLPIIGDA